LAVLLNPYTMKGFRCPSQTPPLGDAAMHAFLPHSLTIQLPLKLIPTFSYPPTPLIAIFRRVDKPRK